MLDSHYYSYISVSVAGWWCWQAACVCFSTKPADTAYFNLVLLSFNVFIFWQVHSHFKALIWYWQPIQTYILAYIHNIASVFKPSFCVWDGHKICTWIFFLKYF